MYVRLAFAVADHLEPEILIVDEVLAVGDAAFQKKCLGKMGEVSEKDGRTVLFVSHNMTMIEQLCPRALLINSGNLSKDSSSYMVIGEYFNSTKQDLIMKSNSHSIVTLLSFDVCIESDEYPTNISNGDKLSIQWSFILRATKSIAFCLIIEREGTLVCAINTYHQNALFQELFPDHYVCKVNIPEYTLNPGFHSFGLNISDQAGNEIWFQANNLIGLNILDDNYRRGNLFKGKWPGAVSLLPQVCIQKIKKYTISDQN
jgi:lipopolysaccharide transport system ATP-binding protein